MQRGELLPALTWGPLSGHYLPDLVTQPTSVGHLTMSAFRDLRYGHELDFSYTSWLLASLCLGSAEKHMAFGWVCGGGHLLVSL